MRIQRPCRLPLSASLLLLLLLLLLPAASLIRVRSWGRGKGVGVKKERIIRELESKRWRDPSGGIMSYALSMSYATSWRRSLDLYSDGGEGETTFSLEQVWGELLDEECG